MADDVGYLSGESSFFRARRGVAACLEVGSYLRCGGRAGPALRGFVALCLLGAVWTLNAQPAANLPAAWFTVFSAKPIKGLTYLPKPGAPAQKVAFYPTARSQRNEFRGAMPLRFLDEKGGVVAEATIPRDIRDALLLFTPLENPPAEGQPGLRYQVAVLDDSTSRQGPGSLAIINLSGLSLAGTVNKQSVSLSAGLNPAITVGRSAAIVLRATANKKTYQSYSATVPLTPKQRALLILLPPFYKGSVEAQARMLLDEPVTRPH